jgi:hypothetical protein
MLAANSCNAHSSPEGLIIVDDSTTDWQVRVRQGLKSLTPVLVHSRKAPMSFSITADTLHAWTTDPLGKNRKWGTQCKSTDNRSLLHITDGQAGARQRFFTRATQQARKGVPPDYHHQNTLPEVINNMHRPDLCFNALDIPALKVGPCTIVDPE